MIKSLQAILFIICLYSIVSLATILKNHHNLFDSPGLLTRLKIYLTKNIAETSKNSPFPELVERQYPLSVEATTNKVIQAAKELGYQLQSQEAEKLHFTVTSSLFKFVDDVYISIDAIDTADSTEVNNCAINARSQSRKGRADFAANTKNITRLFSRLEKSL